MRVPVHEQREILQRFQQQPNESNRSVGRALGRSANTIQSLRDAIRKSGLAPEALFHLDDRQWTAALGNDDRSIAQRKTAPDWEVIREQMEEKNATLHQLWMEFRELHPGGIGYTQFTSCYALFTSKLDVVLRRPHTPGEKLYCDFAGATIHIHDADGGPGFDAQIFVSALGYSSYVFTRAVASQQTADWNACHVQAFEFYGGVPEWTVSDNLKSAVTKRTRDELIINKAHRECLSYYGCHAMPRGVRKPRQNAKAEAAVQIVQRWILFSLRGRKFFSLAELNRELDIRRDQLNARPFKKIAGCRKSRFEEVERAALKPLPDRPFEPREWRFEVLVGPDYVFEHERKMYSAPYELRGERVDLRITANVIEVMFRGKRVAVHQKAKGEGEINILREHMPVSHTRVLDGEPKALMTWATSVGAATEAMFTHHLRERADATNGLRTTRRLRELARHHGEQRFEEVCAYAGHLNMTSLRSLESILKTSPDKRPKSDAASAAKKSPHENVRGANYYGEEA